MAKRKAPKLPTPQRGQVAVQSFDKGLVTLVPSDQAGTSGMSPPDETNPQASTIQLGPDDKNAVVVASNMRFGNGAGQNAPGYETVAADGLDAAPLLLYQSTQIGSTIVSSGNFKFVCTAGKIFLATEA